MADDNPKSADSDKRIDHSAEPVRRNPVVNQQSQERSRRQADSTGSDQRQEAHGDHGRPEAERTLD